MLVPRMGLETVLWHPKMHTEQSSTWVARQGICAVINMTERVTVGLARFSGCFRRDTNNEGIFIDILI